MPSQSTDDLIQEIRSKLEHIFPGDPCIDVGVSSMYGLITSYADKKVREARIDELKRLDLNNNPQPCTENCSEIEHARHEGQYDHYIHIESYKNGRIAQLKESEE